MENFRKLLDLLKSLNIYWRIALIVSMAVALLSLSSCTRGFYMKLQGSEVDFELRDTTATKSMK